ncbi:neurotrophin receptor-interacting factor homolog [Aethina tumida]|uniref:neurotrophin receptor-interacting factor homolog n=1 Tax=Aethina tumida TaxID=116153 RepID=UPI002148DB44|nr:neurotrophin receptor-interacting factor homolog [Aethina tumida]
MNFSPFGVPLSAALPVATQFAAGKITQSVTTPSGQVVGVLQGGENGIHYIRPVDANAFSQSVAAQQQQQQQQHQQQQQQQQQQSQTQTLITLPITMPGAKPGDPQQTVQIQVVNPITAATPVSQASPSNSPKYHISAIPIQTLGQGTTVVTVAYNTGQDGLQIVDGSNGIPECMTVVAALQPQDLQLLQTASGGNAEPDKQQKEHNPVALIKSEMNKEDGQEVATTINIPAQYMHSTQAVQEYIQKIQQTTALHQFLKFNNSDSNIKREQMDEEGTTTTTINVAATSVLEGVSLTTADEHEHLLMHEVGEAELETEEGVDDPDSKGKKKKKHKKKPPKPKKPKPGQVHIATALDGTTLFCCPECHMAYPEKELLEHHLVGHKIERRFICDICGAGLKRKEHLERHKLGHNPERPFVCSVCLKGFKRKEHLNLHFVIHSGEKTEICTECGKGFYRKDHLRKHARSHITRRAKEMAERQNLLGKEGGGGGTSTTAQVTIQVPSAQQIQIPVQIQVPQTIQMAASAGQQEEEGGEAVSTVVLPSATEGISIMPH